MLWLHNKRGHGANADGIHGIEYHIFLLIHITRKYILLVHYGCFDNACPAAWCCIVVPCFMQPFAWDCATAIVARTGYELSGLWLEVAITGVFVSLQMVHDLIIQLPFSLYSTFVVEQVTTERLLCY